MKVFTEREQELFARSHYCVRHALDVLVGVVNTHAAIGYTPLDSPDEDLAVAMARLGEWIAANEGRWVA